MQTFYHKKSAADFCLVTADSLIGGCAEAEKPPPPPGPPSRATPERAPGPHILSTRAFQLKDLEPANNTMYNTMNNTMKR
uniref:Uncharacterized protein n=1 Tax=Knipowitschia caucasica TaxID=637954 RepID=A0AAV2LLE9_KNICA